MWQGIDEGGPWTDSSNALRPNTSTNKCLTSLTLGDFEPVNVSSLMVSNDSGATSH